METSFAQIQKDRIKCCSCGVRGHYAWECPDLTPQQQAKYHRKNSNKWKNDDSSVGSNGSSKTDGSGSSLPGTIGSDSSGSTSQLVRRRGRCTPTPSRGEN